MVMVTRLEKTAVNQQEINCTIKSKPTVLGVLDVCRIKEDIIVIQQLVLSTSVLTSASPVTKKTLNLQRF